MVAGAIGQEQGGYTPDFSPFQVSFNYAKGEGFGADRMTGKQMYYKKPVGGAATDEGYVFVASATPNELVRMLDKGYMPLRQFGEFQLWNPQENWRVSNEPYRRIFQRPGGLMIFPVAQIIEHKWHLVPPYAGVTFPQLGGVELLDIRCVECRQWFVNPDLLRKHRSVAHRATSQNSAMGESIAQAVAKMNEPLNATLGPMVQAMEQMMRQQMQQFAIIAERLNLSDRERAEMKEFIEKRFETGAAGGVPPAPPAPTPEEVAEAAKTQPIEANAINVNAGSTRGHKKDPATPEGG